MSDQALEKQRELWERWKRGSRKPLAAFPHDSERGPHGTVSRHDSTSCSPCGGTGRVLWLFAVLDVIAGCHLLPGTQAVAEPGPCAACGGTGRQWWRAR